MKTISVMIPCFNECKNIGEMYNRLIKVFETLPTFQYEFIFADNASTDGSEQLLRELAKKDEHVKVIINNRNFGSERSCTNAFLQCYGDAVIIIAADLQDPPELILEFIQHWEDGYKLVLGQKRTTKDTVIIKKSRELYYKIMGKLSENGHIPNVTGFGLYDKTVMDMLRWLDDPLPYTRGIICDLGYSYYLVQYDKNDRQHGKSSFNYYRYIDTAIWGIISSTKKPLRFVTILGFWLSFSAIISLLVNIGIALLKATSVIYIWASIIAVLLGLSILCMGILAEYIGLIILKITKRPFTTSKETINFEKKDTSNKMYGH